MKSWLLTAAPDSWFLQNQSYILTPGWRQAQAAAAAGTVQALLQADASDSTSVEISHSGFSPAWMTGRTSAESPYSQIRVRPQDNLSKLRKKTSSSGWQIHTNAFSWCVWEYNFGCVCSGWGGFTTNGWGLLVLCDWQVAQIGSGWGKIVSAISQSERTPERSLSHLLTSVFLFSWEIS